MPFFATLLESSTAFADQNHFSWPSGLLLEDAIKAGGLAARATPSAAEIVTGSESLKADTTTS
jgi:hypothetical protein